MTHGGEGISRQGKVSSNTKPKEECEVGILQDE